MDRMHCPQPNIEIVHLNETHRESVESLCEECFPIHYPDWWYNNILSDRVQFSIGAFNDVHLVGMIVAEYQSPREAREQGKISYSCSNYSVLYIISLGVRSEYRRQGIARKLICLLLDSLNTNCKLVYLHVQSTNDVAINFYQWQNFQEYRKVPGYYTINDTPADALVYTYPIHGGPTELVPWTDLFLNSIYMMYDWTYTQFQKLFSYVKENFT